MSCSGRFNAETMTVRQAFSSVVIGASVVPCSAALFGELLDHGPDPRIPADEPVAPKANTDPNTGPNIPNTPNTAAGRGWNGTVNLAGLAALARTDRDE